MKHSLIQLNDLPDEILMIILKKLDNNEVFYSLIGVNKRLNTLVHDTIFTSHLTLMKYFSDDSINPLSDTILDRFYSQILPAIRHQIQWLDVESSSMERILLSTNYANLYRLGLYNLEIERAKHLFTNSTILTDLFKNKILSLIIHISKSKKQTSTKDANTIIFTDIFTIFTNLQELKFDSNSINPRRLSFDIPPPICISSTLLELHINVTHFYDCIYLLDGRFNQLRVLHVNTFWIRRSSRRTINNTENLPNLKCFSLQSDTDVDDELIFPLLHRMLNLEKLHLCLKISGRNSFIHGNNLKIDIMNHMSQLNQFTFNIRSTIRLHNQISFLSNEDIQHTFNDFQNNQIISCVDYFSEMERGQCHIYTYPYQLKEYHQITNSFPGGIFKYVREISLFDERPFQHEFFFQISQSFPFMKKLTLINQKPQNDKRYRKVDDDNQHLSIIEYPNLSHLNLDEAHDDYIEQFLIDTKTCLPNTVYLSVDYQVLKRVTQHFTRNTTRINCTKLCSLGLIGICQIPKYVKEYFPYTRIL
ncbi:unnamed protein product [Rotaria magnacalcarata]|uniref:F-box domain-containing protein n=2 Tax=Rotaria magnacalcarata TaxID=392030 RepID=A0A814H689_9BILA|nr:unnamed protein product [Rotaria magnacalcarata]CAF1261265.1 unnamed protein product [Rotaria magnacalcarata]CAF3830345.1 unnamed protein product [Rotaria magnacalcarata]CAF4122314.1 unnamed protein product [Rotaria magnacalcarata]